MTRTVLRAILHGAGDLRLETSPLERQALEPHDVYVETEWTAFSTGTDLGNYEGGSLYVPDGDPYPRVVGYSNVGRVVEVGSSVTAFAPGQRVFSMKPHQSAYLAGDAQLLVPVPAAVPPDEASLAYLTELGYNALHEAEYRPGENVAVVGLGVIGLCTVAVARALGARVVGIANSSSRVDAALQAGADAAFLSSDCRVKESVDDMFRGIGADVVVLTANPWPAYRTALEIAAIKGRVSILGFPGRAQEPPDFNPMDPAWIYAKQLTLKGVTAPPLIDCSPAEVRFNLRRNLQYVLDLMGRGSLRLSGLITHRIPAKRMREAYELARLHSKDLVAAVFDWSDAART